MLRTHNLYSLIFLFLAGIMIISPGFLLDKANIMAKENPFFIQNSSSDLAIFQNTTLFASTPAPYYKDSDIKHRYKVIVTAYSSSVWETQGDPFITASGERVADGIVANNLLSFGTKIRLPEIFEDKVFVVKDRMHYRKGDFHIDIWFPSRQEALNFGSKLTDMEVFK